MGRESNSRDQWWLTSHFAERSRFLELKTGRMAASANETASQLNESFKNQFYGNFWFAKTLGKNGFAACGKDSKRGNAISLFARTLNIRCG